MFFFFFLRGYGILFLSFLRLRRLSSVSSEFAARQGIYHHPPPSRPDPTRFNCKDAQGRRWLTYTSAAPGSETEKRLRGRKITPKRGGRDDRRRKFSEYCNRHEWGLIDGPPLPPCGRRPQLAGRNFTNFHYARRQAARAETRARDLDCSLARRTRDRVLEPIPA